MSMFSDIAHEHSIERIRNEIEVAKQTGKPQEYIDGLLKAIEIIYGCM